MLQTRVVTLMLLRLLTARLLLLLQHHRQLLQGMRQPHQQSSSSSRRQQRRLPQARCNPRQCSSRASCTGCLVLRPSLTQPPAAAAAAHKAALAKPQPLVLRLAQPQQLLPVQQA